MASAINDAAGNGGDPLDTTNPSNPDGKITLSQTWDKNSRLKTQADDKGNVTTYDYDALNRRFKTTYADGSFEQTTFDANDNVATYTDENGTARTCSYDQINRLTQCSVARATGVIGTTLQTHEYDGLSRKTLCTDNNDPADGADDSTVTTAYDSLSRQIEEVQSISDGTSAKVVSSNWQANNHRVDLVYPNDRQTTYTFDDFDRYLQIGGVANYAYIGYRVQERTSQNGVCLAPVYDNLRRVSSQRHLRADASIVAQFSHTYNRTNNRLNEIREHHLDGGLRVGEQYTFDSLYRLTNFQVGTFTAGGAFNAPLASQQWQLDGVGNWSLFTDNGTPKTQTINSVNEYTAFGGTANAFDANKNLTDDGTNLYAFDFLNRLREVRRKSDNVLISSYTYDSNGSSHLMGAGRRIRKVTTSDSSIGATLTTFVYDDIMTIEERDGMDAVLRQYVNGQRIDEHLSMDTYTSGSISTTHYYHENALGNVVALTDSTGTVVERYTYLAYGTPEFRDPLNSLLSTFSSLMGNPFLFNGQRFDPETGFSYYRHRYLNHSQGRFVNRDPAGIDRLMNLYEYAGSNALNLMDPSGLTTVNIISEHTTTGDPFLWWWVAGDMYRIGTERDAAGKVIKDPAEQLAEILEKYSGCIKELNLSGHGYGAGISTEEGWKSGINQNMDDVFAKRIAKKLCKNAIVNICSCAAARDDAKHQRMANKLQAKVCACTESVTWTCSCEGKWICKNPNNVDDDVLKAREKEQDVPKKKAK